MDTLIDRDAGKGEALRRMSWIATLLLILVTVLYIVARGLEWRYPGLAVVSAFAEAAMVGALADWFAVVALFRHPLGIPIPHTAVIPLNKGRVADNVGSFITSNFLGTATILERIRAFDPAAKFAQWLAQREVAARLGAYAAQVIAFWLEAVEDRRVQRFLRDAVTARLVSMDVARAGGELLDVLTQNRRHQQLLDGAIRFAAGVLARDATRAMLARRIEGELNAFLKAINYGNYIGDYAANRLVAGVARFLEEVAGDAQHPLRQRFDEIIQDFIAKLKGDPDFRLKAQQIRDRILGQPEVADYLEGLWAQLRTWLRDDLASEESSVMMNVAAALSGLAATLDADRGMQAWINENILRIAASLIEQHRASAGRFIAAQVRAWDDRQLVREFELNIGRDLQYIRINGTLVGGLVGLLIFGFTGVLQRLLH